jgi:hypothetical protein
VQAATAIGEVERPSVWVEPFREAVPRDDYRGTVMDVP